MGNPGLEFPLDGVGRVEQIRRVSNRLTNLFPAWVLLGAVLAKKHFEDAVTGVSSAIVPCAISCVFHLGIGRTGRDP